MEVQKEFDRQVLNLIVKAYPEAAGVSTEEFVKIIKPLGNKLKKLKLGKVDLVKGKLPFVIVVKSEVVLTEKAMSLVEREGKSGVTKLYPHSPEDFKTISEVKIPKGNVYLLIDIDRGKKTLNVRPSDAFKEISAKKRSPLTVDEGIAVITHFPEFLMKNNCFSLLASRHVGDKRVPAIWINAKKEPNLGWCWEGNPHTWLGSASCSIRI